MSNLMLKVSLCYIISLFFVFHAHANEQKAILTDLGKNIYITSIASHELITVVVGRRTVNGSHVPVAFISNEFSKWKELTLPGKELKKGTASVIGTNMDTFYLCISSPQSHTSIFYSSKNGIDWKIFESTIANKKEYPSLDWRPIDAFTVGNEKISVQWDGNRYILYNTYHKRPLAIWQQSSVYRSLAPLNTEFESYCFNKGKVFVSNYAGIVTGPTPIASSPNLYNWTYPMELRPSTRDGNKIYKVHCLGNGTVIGTGNSEGTFYDQPNIKGMMAYRFSFGKDDVEWDIKYIKYPISDSTMVNTKLYVVGWNKQTKNYFYGDTGDNLNNTKFHHILPNRFKSVLKITANKKQITIAGNNLIYQIKSQ